MSSATGGEQCYEKCIMALAAAKEQEPVKISHALRCALAAAEATGHDLAKTVVLGCAAKVCLQFSNLVSLIQKHFESLRDKLIELYNGMEGLPQFEDSMVQGMIDAKLTNQLCESKGLQMNFHLLAYGMPSIQGAQKLLKCIAGATGHADFNNDGRFAKVRKEVRDTSQALKAFLECEPSDSQPIVLSTIASTIGNATVAQAVTRALKTGEIRQGLVNRAQAGVKKRRLENSCYSPAAVLNGEAGAK